MIYISSLAFIRFHSIHSFLCSSGAKRFFLVFTFHNDPERSGMVHCVGVHINILSVFCVCVCVCVVVVVVVPLLLVLLLLLHGILCYFSLFSFYIAFFT